MMDEKRLLKISCGPFNLPLRDATIVYAAGTAMAAIGAGNQNWDLIQAGANLQQLSPLVFAVSYALRSTIRPPMDLAGNELVKVSHWGSKELMVGNWIMRGGVTRLNYWLSGKGQPNWFPGGNQYAPYNTGWETWLPASELLWPMGWQFWKGLLGQRMYGTILN